MRARAAVEGPAASPPLPPRLIRLLHEARWLALLGAGGFLALVLGTYQPADAGWSHSGTTSIFANAGGPAGAWLADVLLYALGLSAWWLVAASLAGLVALYRRLDAPAEGVDRRSLWIALAGFAVFLLASCGFEAMRLHSLTASLPYRPGGAVGVGISSLLLSSVGFSGGTLLLLVGLAAGFSISSGLSWIRVCEGLGLGLEVVWTWVRQRWEERRDREIGEAATAVREAVVEEVREKLDDHEPVHIEPPVVAVPQSERVDRERQQPLFEDLPDSPLPPLKLLDEADDRIEVMSPEILEFTSRLIEKKLLDFGIEVKVLAAYPGPVITRYEVEPATGVKGSQIVNLVKDLARALSVMSIRVVETIPGKSCMGLEIPNPRRQVVRLSEILGSEAYAAMGSRLTLVMGKDIAGKPVVADLARMPHLLVAGTTGSGKSVAVNAMILSLLYKSAPREVRLILVDPKMLELSVYEGIPHLLAPVVTDMKHAAHALQWCVAEMDRRYRLLSALGVRNLSGYHQKLREAEKAGTPLTMPLTMTLSPDNPEPLSELPAIVVVIDELADLMMVVGKKVEELIARLAQKARAAGIHLVLATQRPSVDVITGLIKANIPTRVAFQVSSKIDSRTILDQMGAEALLGQGDMLFLPPGTGLPQRVHGAFVADEEVHRVVEYLKSRGEPQYVEGILDGPDAEGGESGDGPAGEGGGGGESDPLYDEAVAIVLKSRRASISLVQRHLRIGYNRAARLIEQMEVAGVVSPMATNGNRDVLVPARSE